MQIKILIFVLGFIVVMLTIAAPGSAVASWIIDGTRVRTVEWDSGHSNNLSSWKKATCTNSYGPNYLLTRVRAWREPSANLDNFIAKLTARCTDFQVQGGIHLEQTDDYDWVAVYAGSYRHTSGYTSQLVHLEYPIGLRISINPGWDYVKDAQLLFGSAAGNVPNFHLASYAFPRHTTWVLDNGAHNTTRELLCEDQYVLTGLALKYSTQNGKIRRIKIYCRQMSWQ
jgi:hypothetical protein